MGDELTAPLLREVDRILSDAQAVSRDLGFEGEAGAITVLMQALAQAVANAAGPAANQARVERAATMAGQQLFELVPARWYLFTRLQAKSGETAQ